MKKFTIVALVLVLCLGALGFGYAAWNDEVDITGTVQTGSLDLSVTAYSGTDVYKILTSDEIVRYHWRAVRPPAPPDSELIAYAIAEMAGDDQVQVTFDNLFPDVEGGFVADWLMQYTGGIPGKLMVATEVEGIPDDWVTFKAYPVDGLGFEGPEVTLEGLQLHCGDRVAVHIIVEVPQIPESMDVSGTITMTILAVQWNAYCGFTTYAQPGDGTYLADTTKIDISGLTEYTDYSSISDGTMTVSFATPMGKRTVPDNWATWSAPPDSESSTPHVLFCEDTAQTLSLSAPCRIFGFELEPNPYDDFDYDVDFILSLDGTIVRTISMTVNGYQGARLFAGEFTGGCSFDTIEIVGGAEFAIAQVRYALA